MTVTQIQVDQNNYERDQMVANSSLKFVLMELSVILFVEDNIKSIQEKDKH